VTIAWRAQHEVHCDRPPAPDFLAFDGERVVGWMFEIGHVGRTGRWLWALTATEAGPFDGPTCGVEERQDDAARCLIDAYDHLTQWRSG
jgi:hypothetical protein